MLLNVSHHFEHGGGISGEPAGPHAAGDAGAREVEPSGTATTVRRERWFADGAPDVWVFYADNLSDLRLAPMRGCTQRMPIR